MKNLVRIVTLMLVLAIAVTLVGCSTFNKVDKALTEIGYTKIENNIIKSAVSTVRGAVYYATARAYGEDANHRLTLRLTDGEQTLREYSYFVSAQKTDIYLPFIASGEESFVEVLSEDGGIFYKALIPTYKPYLKPCGFMAFEIGRDQGQMLSALADENGFSCEILKDFSGNDRVAVLKPKTL